MTDHEGAVLITNITTGEVFDAIDRWNPSLENIGSIGLGGVKINSRSSHV